MSDKLRNIPKRNIKMGRKTVKVAGKIGRRINMNFKDYLQDNVKEARKFRPKDITRF